MTQPRGPGSRLLDKNVPITPEERMRYQQFLDRFPAQLALFDDHIAKMTHALNIFHYARDKLVSTRDLYKQILDIKRPHINMLPEAVLLRIFCFLRDDEAEEVSKAHYLFRETNFVTGYVSRTWVDYHDTVWPHIGSKRRNPVSWLLSKVCKGWYEILKTCPSMWKHVYLDLGATKESLAMECATLQVSYSRPEVLQVFVKSTPWFPKNDGPGVITFVKGREKENQAGDGKEKPHGLTLTNTGVSAKRGTRVFTADSCHPFLQPIITDAGRVGSLVLEIPLDDYDALAKMRGRLASLHTVTVHIPPSFIPRPMTDVLHYLSKGASSNARNGDRIDLLGDAPRLHDFTLCGYDVDLVDTIQRFALPRNQLSHLAVHSHSASLKPSSAKPSMELFTERFLDIVKSQSRLRTLVLYNLIPSILESPAVPTRAQRKARKVKRAQTQSASVIGDAESPIVHSELYSIRLTITAEALPLVLKDLTTPKLNSLELFVPSGRIPFSSVAKFLNKSHRATSTTEGTGQPSLRRLVILTQPRVQVSFTEAELAAVFQAAPGVTELSLVYFPNFVYQDGFLDRLLAMPSTTHPGPEILPLPYLVSFQVFLPMTDKTLADCVATVFSVMLHRLELEHKLMTSNARPGLMDRALRVGAGMNKYTGTCLKGIFIRVRRRMMKSVMDSLEKPPLQELHSKLRWKNIHIAVSPC
ncbi:hypothetical protein VKT23_009845 [Stygiomarasmius scandens]|uniref:F-box domain-containing protein n=1 Tax=Marasmiellus scandens TaxID=2682957 RepID=A0ABR1JIR3_9AGAR